MRRIAIIGTLCLLVAFGAALGAGRRDQPQAEARPTRIILLSSNICGALRALAANSADAPDIVFACSSPRGSGGQTIGSPGVKYGPDFVPNVVIIAAAVMRNGKDDAFTVPSSPPPGWVFHCNNEEVVGDDDDDDGVISEEELKAAQTDDLLELICALDARDGEIDNQFKIRPEDIVSDLDGNHLQQSIGTASDALTIFAFVDDDGPVNVETTKGSLDTGGQNWLCDTEDEDCDGDGTAGDGLVVNKVVPDAAATRSDLDLGAAEVRVTQELIRLAQAFTIVGDGEDVSFFTLETSFMAGLTKDDCPLETTVAGFTSALGNPRKSIAIARAADNDGQNVAGTFMNWSTDDEDKAIMAAGLTPTLDLGGFGFGAPNVICGTKEAGTVTMRAEIMSENAQQAAVTVTFDRNPYNGPTNATSDDIVHYGTFQWTVIGEAANLALAVAPASIPCDGSATAEVSATITDQNGDPVSNNLEVNFKVQVLGTANPIVGKTNAEGVAKSTITPLAPSATGVPVVVSVDDLTSSILVNCSGAAAGGGTTPPGGGTGGTPSGVITGPDTGSGGDAAGAGALPVWPAVALFVGAMALVGGRFALARTTR